MNLLSLRSITALALLLLVSGNTRAQDFRAGSAAQGYERWEYAVLKWEADGTTPTQRVTWEGPTSKLLQADGFKALGGKLKVEVIQDSPTALLNALGNSGWELATLNYRQGPSGSVRMMDWTFKRRK